MSMGPQGPGWWQASDGRWYPPQQGGLPPPGSPSPGIAWQQPPPRSGMSTGAIVAIVLAVVFVVLGGGAALVVFSVGNQATEKARAACETERATLITAVEAAKVSNESFGGNETWRDYVDQTRPLSYFQPDGTDVRFVRISTNLVPTSLCEPISDGG